jgi:radical SAM protein with 4Fe4S-binding SPASM domain
MERKSGLMNLDTFTRTLETVGDSLIYLLLYHQGEPFINRDFLKFVEHAKRKRIFVTTSTNAHYFDPHTARRTVTSGLDSIIISVDGADQSTYEKYRVRGNLEKVEEGIKNLVGAKRRLKSKTPVIYVQSIVMQHNEHQLAEMGNFARELGADKFIKKTVQVETAEEARDWLPKADAYTRYRVTENNLETKRLVKTPCHRPWTSSSVNWDGSVVPCCFDKNSRHELGTLLEETDFSRIWESQQYEGFRAKMLTDRSDLDICSNCSQSLRLFV